MQAKGVEIRLQKDGPNQAVYIPRHHLHGYLKRNVSGYQLLDQSYIGG